MGNRHDPISASNHAGMQAALARKAARRPGRP